MSSSSDSEDDDFQMKQFLEAADTTLLTNAMFQIKASADEAAAVEDKSHHCQMADTSADIKIPEAVRCHIAKKLRALIGEQVEFCDFPQEDALPQRKKSKSKVKLLSGCESYVKPYEEFEFETMGPQKKPNITRRLCDGQNEIKISEQQRLRSVAVSAHDIIGGIDLKYWASKPERKDKVFQYKMAGDGSKMLHAKDRLTEFTLLRRRNKWNESKIGQTPGW